ncbi:MAG: NAD-dependent dihydropyrimidine dehydrogenase subunit PreA [Rhodothermales bacterium]|nr:NAD-dependent dihydropyrimidine dehydrogenase subunit PreA [Rhodothermales bacterium]MBO6779951.1 NAD-dependent dihydropyrimidine dehydrogenase subunit PreA [Rhodothermales bacterium]
MKQPDLTADVAGIRSPNPFWLASGPPTNSAYQVRRAFEAGWGGVVWKTVGHEPAVNVSSRYGSIDYDGRRMVGLNNIELITDRSLEDNLEEIRAIKREFPNHAVVVSLMVESTQDAWHDVVRRVEDTGCDGLELNFGCPHGMSERGMGSAVGQVPEYTCMVTEWAKEVASTPVLVKLTPNVTDIRGPGRAAAKAGADGISLINTINSIVGVDLDTLAPRPQVAGRGSHGGYCGPAVKPIALNMVQQIASDPDIGLPVSGIGGVQTWQDAVEFLLLGAGNVQVCTAAMHYGFRIVEQLESGLKNWMREKGFETLNDFVGASVARVGAWNQLDLGYKVVADIDQDTCIHCGLCYIACEDGAHQSISRTEVPLADFLANGLGTTAVMESGKQTVVAGAGHGYVNRYEIKKDTCVGCNLCSLVCPVSGCISMVEMDSGLPSMNWSEYQEKLARGEVDRIEPPGHV